MAGRDIRAAVSREFRAPLTLETVRLSPPRAGEVRVRLTAVAICHSDLSYIDNAWGGDLPAVWGHEAAGVVVETGPEVSNVAVADHVAVTLVRSCGRCRRCARGLSVACPSRFALDEASPLSTAGGNIITQGLRTAAFAEETVVHASQVVAVPADVPPGSAALLACGGITGFGAVVNTARVEPGSSVIVVGTGGVGLHAVQGARHAGAGPIAAVDLDERKLRWARRLGATHTVNPATSDVAAAVADATGGALADYVFVATGAPAAINRSYPLVAPTGTLVLVGMPASGVMMDLDVGTFATQNQRVLGSKMGTATVAADIPRLVGLYERGELELDGLIDGCYPFARINDAIDDARRGHAIRNVVVFDEPGGAPQ